MTKSRSDDHRYDVCGSRLLRLLLHHGTLLSLVQGVPKLNLLSLMSMAQNDSDFQRKIAELMGLSDQIKMLDKKVDFLIESVSHLLNNGGANT